MNNFEIDTKMSSLVKTERKTTREILELIILAEHQRLPLERGFKDTYDWMIRGHGYSGAAANRRIQAARLLSAVPEVASQVENGSLSLTTLWQAQRTIRAQQKITGSKVSLSEKRAALKKIEGKTSEVVERELNTLFPAAVISGEKTVHKRDGGQRILVELTLDEANELQRSRELLSHALPQATYGQLIGRLAREYNRRAATPHGVAGCSFKDPVSGRVCGSRFQPEKDHIVPKAKGGSDHPSNLRPLCRRHNQLVAEIELGREFMDRRRAKKPYDSAPRATDIRRHL